MARNDWLIGGDRRSEAAERIYAAATDLVSRTGFENFSIEALAAAVHCAPATIYRRRQPPDDLRGDRARFAHDPEHCVPAKGFSGLQQVRSTLQQPH